MPFVYRTVSRKTGEVISSCRKGNDSYYIKPKHGYTKWLEMDGDMTVDSFSDFYTMTDLPSMYSLKDAKDRIDCVVRKSDRKIIYMGTSSHSWSEGDIVPEEKIKSSVIPHIPTYNGVLRQSELSSWIW